MSLRFKFLAVGQYNPTRQKDHIGSTNLRSRLETSLNSWLLTFIETLQFFLQLRHVLFELDRFFLLGVVLSVRFKIDLGDLFVLAIELVQFHNWVGLSRSVWRVVSEFVSFTVLLDAHLVALLAKSEVEAFAAVDAYVGKRVRTKSKLTRWRASVGNLRFHFYQFNTKL